jgi:hypothetical protein
VYEPIAMEEIIAPTLARFEDVCITEEWTANRIVPCLNEQVDKMFKSYTIR